MYDVYTVCIICIYLVTQFTRSVPFVPSKCDPTNHAQLLHGLLHSSSQRLEVIYKDNTCNQEKQASDEMKAKERLIISIQRELQYPGTKIYDFCYHSSHSICLVVPSSPSGFTTITVTSFAWDIISFPLLLKMS